MNKIELVLSKVSQDRKDSLLADLKKAKDKAELKEVIARYGITFTSEEMASLMSADAELSDEDLENVAGGSMYTEYSWYCTGKSQSQC